MFKRSTALLVCCLAFSAQAATIDFEGLSDGTAPGELYASQGIHFTGGSIRHNKLGAYVYGPVNVTFSSPIDQISFGADGPNYDSFSRICYRYGCEPILLESASNNPTTGTGKNLDWYPGQVWDTTWKLPEITSILFNTIALDNLRFTLPSFAAAGGSVVASPSGTVPEPSTIGLILAGALLLRRRAQA